MKHYLLLFFCLLFSGLYAQVSFEAVSSSNVIRVGERVKIQYVITSNDVLEDIPSIAFPNFTGFQIVGSSTSRNVSINNGEVKKQFIENVLLQPVEAGNYTIPPAQIKVDGKTLKTNAVVINVLNIQDEKRNPGIVFLQLSLSSNEVYEQQSVVATLKLYAKTFDALRRRSDVVVPKLNGFNVKKITSGIDDRSYSQEYIGNNQYISEEIAKFALYPNKTGEIVIPTFELRIAIPIDFFDERIILVKSNTEKLLVKKLPSNAPDDFIGAIGEFELRSFVDKTNLEAKEATKLHVIIEGKGNLNTLDFPTISTIEGLEVYPPKRIEKINQKDSIATGSIEQNYILVPTKSGSLSVPSIQLSFFNLETGKYESCSTNPIEIQVEEDVELIKIKEKDTIIRDSINPIDEDKIWDDFRFRREITFGDTTFPFWLWFLPFALILLLIFFYFIFRYKKKKTKEDTTVNKIVKKDILADLENLETESKKGNTRDYTGSSSKLLQDLIQYISGEDKLFFSLREGKEILRNHKDSSIADQWEKLYNDTQMLSYGGQSTPSDLKQNFIRHKDLVKSIL